MTVIIQSLHIYPLKAGKAIDLPSFKLTGRGPEHDRLWMVVREPEPGQESLTMVTQRDKDCEKLALIESRIQSNSGDIAFFSPDGGHILPDSLLEKTPRLASVHGSACYVRDAGNEAAEFISRYLGQPTRLVKISDALPRLAKAKRYGEDVNVSLADGSQVLIASADTLDTLRPHFAAGSDITMSRFRPNIVLSGLEPFEEDVLQIIKIGDAVLELVKPCERCKVTTIDQASGVIAGKEPLATLIKIRRGKSDELQGVFFGQDAKILSLGEIHVGDQVEIVSRKEMHPALQMAAMKYGQDNYSS